MIMKTIYLNEDDLTMSKNLKSKLERWGFHITNKYDADLYILDLWMDWGINYDEIEIIRDQTDRIIVMFSWYQAPDIVRECLNRWADVYIYKMISPVDLLNRIKALINLQDRLCGKK